MSLTKPPQDASVLFLDMNSFFARVEQQVQPVYRGQPVGIAPYTGNTGCIIAASYEAKALGIKTGFSVGEAKKSCPQIIILPSRPALCHFYHKELVKIVESFSPFIKVLSIDEMSIKLTGSDQNSEKAKRMAFAIKTAISQKVGDWLTCSIGIGPSQFLAKTAAEMKKPDGLFEIKLSNLESIYQSLELTDLCGINYGLARRCRAHGIYNPLDLYRQSLTNLANLLGILGKVWYFRLRGYEVDDLTSPVKSLGHSHVLAPEFRTKEGARKVLLKLVEKAGYRLRQDNLWATGISLSIRFLGAESWHKYKKTSPFQDNRAFFDHSLALLKECSFDYPPLAIYVSTHNLIKNYPKPLSLFREQHKTEELSRAIDFINDRHGASTIYSAALMGAESSAPDRIPFGRPRFDIRHE